MVSCFLGQHTARRALRPSGSSGRRDRVVTAKSYGNGPRNVPSPFALRDDGIAAQWPLQVCQLAARSSVGASPSKISLPLACSVAGSHCRRDVGRRDRQHAVREIAARVDGQVLSSSSGMPSVPLAMDAIGIRFAHPARCCAARTADSAARDRARNARRRRGPRCSSARPAASSRHRRRRALRLQQLCRECRAGRNCRSALASSANTTPLLICKVPVPFAFHADRPSGAQASACRCASIGWSLNSTASMTRPSRMRSGCESPSRGRCKRSASIDRAVRMHVAHVVQLRRCAHRRAGTAAESAAASCSAACPPSQLHDR